MKITKLQARRFLLLHHSLIGPYGYKTEADIFAFIDLVGCLQYDPLDICGRNADLVLQSRVLNYRKDMLDSLLYKKRLLIDHFDKNMAIYLLKEWPCFQRIRNRFNELKRNEEQLLPVYSKIRAMLQNQPYLNNKDLEFKEKADWFWGPSSLGRIALEKMYFRGEILIHHKEGNLRFFSLASQLLPQDILKQPDPHQDEIDYLCYRVYRRIKGVGLLWNKASDAFLFIEDLNSEKRNHVFQELVESSKIKEVEVEGINVPFYYSVDEEALLAKAISDETITRRVEFLAPLDNMLWDRKLIKALFDFDYRWEVYTPKEQRKYGYYVLPILYGTEIIGRIEMVADRKRKILVIKSVWFENSKSITKSILRKINKRIERFAAFNDLKGVEISEEGKLFVDV